MAPGRPSGRKEEGSDGADWVERAIIAVCGGRIQSVTQYESKINYLQVVFIALIALLICPPLGHA